MASEQTGKKFWSSWHVLERSGFRGIKKRTTPSGRIRCPETKGCSRCSAHRFWLNLRFIRFWLECSIIYVSYLAIKGVNVRPHFQAERKKNDVFYGSGTTGRGSRRWAWEFVCFDNRILFMHLKVCGENKRFFKLLKSAVFLRTLKRVVVDETHLIKEW